MINILHIVAKQLKPIFNFFVDNSIVVLGLLFATGSILIFWYLNQLSDIQIRSTAIKNSRLYSEALTEFRTLYTSEVVLVAKANGLAVTHDYLTRDNAIPLPATLSMLLGNRLGGKGSGVKSSLYSPYPFPWRETTGGITDSFGRDAWTSLNTTPSKSFYRFEEVDGRASLRYATADLMRDSCIDCHNNHPDTPKNDWRVGQVRGILEVITPIETNVILANNMIYQTMYLLVGILIVSLVGIGLVTRKLRIRSIESRAFAGVTNKINRQLAEEMKIRKQIEAKLRKLTHIDALTEIGNRRKFDEEYEREWKRALRNQTSLAVVLIDIDNFKAYNDNYGHLAGDQTLRQIAKVMNEVALRSSDLITRFGGEEFVVLMPETDLRGALSVAENIRLEVEALAIKHSFATACDIVTVSAGVAALLPNKQAKQDQLINQADKSLYYAKESGRNCVKGNSIARVIPIGRDEE